MSKWGMEEQETINAIKKVDFHGDILNIAAGDGRFNNRLLKNADTVTAIDISNCELELLKRDCPKEFREKLFIQKVDITQSFPFKTESFDGIFCTGTLHLFDQSTIIKILKEIKRVLKKEGKIVLDFATDIKRLDACGNPVVFEKEGNYSMEEAITLFNKQLKDFSLIIEKASFTEENLESDTGYQFITGRFLVIRGTKK